jgi:hypothetical protein
MEPIPYPGCYQCPRCGGREVYLGEKTLSATAITVNTASPVDPTFVTANKIDVHRCINCNTEAQYIYHPRKKEEMKQARIKRLKIAGVVVAVLVALAGLNFGANKVKGSVSAARAESSEKSAVQQVEAEYKKWVAAADACNFKENIEKNTSGEDYPDRRSVHISRFIEPAQELPLFWKSEYGVALNCVSKKVINVDLSNTLTYPTSSISSLKKFDSIFLYDEVFSDKTEKGALGKGRNYQAYISFSPADEYKKNDYFFLYFNWQLEPLK